MSNMSYCAFENTQRDLNQLINMFQAEHTIHSEDGEYSYEPLSPENMSSDYERSAFNSIATTMCELLEVMLDNEIDRCSEGPVQEAVREFAVRCI